MFDGCLKNHCENVHQWGQYPCVDPNCEYVGYSQANVNKHRKLHNRVFDSVFEYKCPYPDCESSFTRTGLLETHLNIHRNELKNCEFCQFRYSHKHDYKDHLSHHFCGWKPLNGALFRQAKTSRPREWKADYAISEMLISDSSSSWFRFWRHYLAH